MMIDDTENNEFTELLSGYAAPVEDDGFSAHVLTQAQTPRNTAQKTVLVKSIMVGGAALLAALIAVPQMAGLQHLISGIKLPEISINIASLSEMNFSNTAIFALLAAMLIGLASSFWISEDL